MLAITDIITTPRSTSGTPGTAPATMLLDLHRLAARDGLHIAIGRVREPSAWGWEVTISTPDRLVLAVACERPREIPGAVAAAWSELIGWELTA